VLNTVSRALRKRRLAILRFDPDEARHDPETLHELRKDCKKLRYLLEGFQRLFEPEALQRAVRELKTLQSAMGDTWDLHVHHELLQRLVQGDSSESAPDPGALQLLTTLGERLGSLERKHVALVDAAFARFRAPRVQRLYARLEENRT
jgi:CHAD domain-containing protein